MVLRLTDEELSRIMRTEWLNMGSEIPYGLFNRYREAVIQAARDRTKERGDEDDIRSEALDRR